MANIINYNKNKRVFLRIGQINAGGSGIVADEIKNIMIEKSIDLLLMQEPYCHGQKICGFGLKIMTIEDPGRMSRTRVDKIQSGIIVNNRELTVTKLQQFCNTHITCIQVSTAVDEVYLISVYCQFCDNIEPYIEHLDKVITVLKDKKVIIGMDSNANSPMWNSKHSDARGIELEDLVFQHNLSILNKANQPSTFRNIHGESNIDVTLATSQCARWIKNWQVREGWLGCGDHNLITFELEMDALDITSRITPRFLVDKARWNIFDKILINKIRSENFEMTDRVTIDSAVLALEKSIIDACNIAIPKKRYFSKSVPWWTPELTCLRKEVNKSRKCYQKCKDNKMKMRFRETHHEIRRRYQSSIYKAKQESWKKFVTSTSNNDPWSFIYKLQMDKVVVDKAINSIKYEGSSSTSWRNSRETLLHSLIPDDNCQNDIEWQKSIRAHIEVPPAVEDDPPFSHAEIILAARKTKTRRAPGIDNIDPEVAKRAVNTVGILVTDIFNGCLKHGVFPERWKQGVVRVLLKGQDKDPQLVKSYRPICLLPVLSKIFERVIAERIDFILNRHALCSGRQFGFKVGKSTEDAIVTLRELVDNATEKYVLAILFDISGAFDNVWWPLVLDSLQKRDCPNNIYSLLKDYLSNRNVKIIESAGEVSKAVSKGCPQGSVLGPCLWNLIFDDLLNLISAHGYEPIAYADDLVVVVQGRSRLDLQLKSQLIVNIIEEWCHNRKLQLSSTKTEMILLKGILDKHRPPKITVGGLSLRFSDRVKYLGVFFGPRLSVGPHVSFVCSKGKNMFYKLSQVAHANWGIRYKELLYIYRGLFVPIITYAAAGWADRLTVQLRRKLLAAQRQVLIHVCKAYRTVSADALTTITGSPPVDLLLSERIAIYKLKKKKDFTHGGFSFSFSCEDEVTTELMKNLCSQTRETTISMWQCRWNSSTKARLTYEFIPNISDRLSASWITLNHYTVQILTGHGNFKSKLHYFKLAESPLCRCGFIDTIQHVLFTCPMYEDIRTSFQNQVQEYNPWPCTLDKLLTRDNFETFAKFTNSALKMKEISQL